MRINDLHVRSRIGLLALGLACAATLALAGGRIYSQSDEAAFTVEYVEGTSSPLSKVGTTRELYWAFRGDGAISYGLRGVPSRNRKVLDPTAKIEADVSDALAIKTTYDMSRMPTRGERRRVQSRECAPPPGHAGYRFMGNDVILGHNTYIYEYHPSAESDGTTTITRYWLAPDLRCFELRTTATTRNERGEVTNQFDKTVGAVLMGEPDPALFLVPDTFREVPPSEFAQSLQYDMVAAREGAERAKLLSTKVPPSWKAELARRDARYKALKLRR